MQKAYEASLNGSIVVCLLPSRTDTQWWHRWVMGKAAEVRLVEGRLRFGDQKRVAPFPSVFVIYKPGESNTFFRAWKPDNRRVAT
jgi:site-specific DNA-methyltransferase (adenine-specific)